MQPDQPTPNATDSNAPAESPQQILERRLAELSARPAAPTADDVTERPGQGTPPLPANQPAGAGTAEPDAETTEATTPESGSTEANALMESATHLPENPAAPEVHSAGEARAMAHYDTIPHGEIEAAPAVQPAAAPEPPEAEAPHVTPVIEVAPTETVAEALENAPTVGSLHTSSDEAATTDAAPEAAPARQPAAPAVDFDSLDLPAQAAHLLELLRHPQARKNRKSISDFYRRYDAATKAGRTSSRQQFTEAGGAEEEFSYAGPEGHAELAKAYQEFRDSRVRDAKAEDEQRGKNLAHKQYLLSQLRQLVESAETKDSSARIKALQNDWKATGPVPQQDAQELWNSYHALLDIYYNNRGLFFEMKELDRRRNQEAKEVLIVRAEALAQQSSINKALQELRQLHEEWKHIGPVPNEQRETLWQRFLQASEQVHARKQEFLSARQGQENANLTRKTELLAQLLPFGDFETERVNEWRAKTDELQKLKEAWDAAGLVPRDKAEQMNKQFWGAYKGFFQKKNQFFKALDEEKSTNLKRKIDLCEQAEAALQSPDWEEARQTVIRLQKDWKLIGRVPEKQSDKVWHRFRTACDAFFDRKKEEGRQREQKSQQLSQEQTQHLSQVTETVATLSADQPGSLEGFRQQVAEWRAFDGTTAHGGHQAEERFQALMDQYLTQVPGLSYADRTDLLFSLQVERLKASPDSQQLLYKKEQTLRREINELENDISTLKTNLEFFARSKNANQLREEYQGRIDEAEARIDGLKRQLRAVRS
ncbi:DUF349 domain-containing protein [Hymenobacter rubripertinctus]|uniref:DUF349 domain-containing protein n=1 Tax=Hymenobacter rubripertinctus TaxID=2029981 RepID=A0A418R8G6_9BACT|nr:DUF349 domain-containing protein [Hymenobacter rubripertinctus]RIY13777.1 DUF349 domain-containing protein [Hymenobacter rubripertinctus]